MKHLTLFALVVACSGAAVVRDGRGGIRPLERVRATQVIEQGLTAQGLQGEAGHRIRIAGRVEVDCDVFIRGTRNCIEYTNEADRARYGSAVPNHSNPEALVVVASAEADVGGHVLFVDDRDFVYEPDPERAGPGHPTVGEVEDRLRRMVTDYAVWLRRQEGR